MNAFPRSPSFFDPSYLSGIVILDLDASDSGDDETPSNDPDAELTVSAALLAKLKRLPSIIDRPKDSAENPEKALVLYRPPIWKPPPSPQSRTCSPPADEHVPTGCVPMELDP